MFDKMADLIMKHPKKIVLLWIVLLLISTPFIYKVMVDPSSVLSYDMTGSGDSNESVEGMKIISNTDYFYDSGVDMSTIFVVECDNDKDVTSAVALGKDLREKLSKDYGEKNITVINAGYFSKSADDYPGIEMFAIAFQDNRDAGKEVTHIRELISEVKTTGQYGLTTYLTGSAAIGYDTESGAMSDIERIDPFSILLVLILIGLFFRSIISAATPPITIGFAYGIVMMVLFGLAQFMDIYYITSTIVLVSMLGAGCDYCIFIIARYREGLKSGMEHNTALRESIKWAGESITISGCSVIIGFGVMSFCSFSMISTMGIVLASGIVFALLAALTLIPSILAIVGERIFWPSNIKTYQEGSKAMNGLYGKFSRLGDRYFKKSAKFSIKHAGIIVLSALIITAPLAYVALTESTSYDMIATMPDGEAKSGVNAIVSSADGGMIMPTYVLLDTGREVATIEDDKIHLPYGSLGVLQWTDEKTMGFYLGKTASLGASLMKDDSNISSVSGLVSWDLLLKQSGGDVQKALSVIPSYLRDPVAAIALIPDAQWSAITPDYTKTMAIDYMVNYGLGTMSKFVDGHQYIKMTVVIADEPMSDKSMATIGHIKSTVATFMNDDHALPPAFMKDWTTGSVVAIYDISQIVNNEFTYIEIAVVVLIFFLLFFVMRSYITPLRAILTILMSIMWTLGLTHLLFDGILGIPVTWIAPIILFVICLGLGMDYDILLTTRIKENVSKGMSNDDAIEDAVHRSGAVITICGLIMGGAFGTMMLSSSPMLQEFGFALGFAIIVDALIVRTYIVPAVMHLLGKWNWVGPKFLKPLHTREDTKIE